MSPLPSGRAVAVSVTVAILWWATNGLWPTVATVVAVIGYLAVAVLCVLDGRPNRRRITARATRRDAQAPAEADRSAR